MQNFKLIPFIACLALAVVIIGKGADGYPRKILTPPAIAHGEGLKIGYVNLPNKVFVDSMIDRSSDVSMQIYGPGATKFGAVNCADGRCEFNYYPVVKGDHFVTIKFNGNVIGKTALKVPVLTYRSRNPTNDPRIGDMRCTIRPNERQTQTVLTGNLEGTKDGGNRIYNTCITVRSIGKVNDTVAKATLQKVSTVNLKRNVSLLQLSLTSPTIFIPIIFVILILALHLFGGNSPNELDDEQTVAAEMSSEEQQQQQQGSSSISGEDSNDDNSSSSSSSSEITVLTDDDDDDCYLDDVQILAE